MKVAFAAWGDPLNPHFASGTPLSIVRMLRSCGYSVEIVPGAMHYGSRSSLPILSSLKRAFGDGRVSAKAMLRVKDFYYNRLTSSTFLKEFTPLILAERSAAVEKALAKIDYDLLFAWSSHFTADLNIDKPVVFWNDYTFAGYLDIYPPFAKLCRETVKHGHRMEELTLNKADLAIYSSEWAAKTAADNYLFDQDKLKIIPFGPNMPVRRSKNDINAILEQKDFSCCKLLFVGVDWHTKGGDKAVAVAEELNRRGLKTELNLVGSDLNFELPDFVCNHGFIPKDSQLGIKRLEHLFATAHFLILPSRYECFGIVFAEASSFGLPSLASRVGGVPTAVRNGKNGFTFLPGAAVDEYADCIVKLMAEPQDYFDLALSSFREYETRLNWHKAGETVSRYIKQYCSGSQGISR